MIGPPAKLKNLKSKLVRKVQRPDGSYPNVKPRVKGGSNSQNLSKILQAVAKAARE